MASEIKNKDFLPAVGASASLKALPMLPDTLDIQPPPTDEGRLEFFNRAETMTTRIELEGRWLCGHALHGCAMSSAKVADEVLKRYGRRVSVRGIDYMRALYKAVPEYTDVRSLSQAGITWTAVREALTLSADRQLPRFLEGVRKGVVTAENAEDAVAELKSVVDGGTVGGPALSVDAADAAGMPEAGAAEPGEMEYDAEAAARRMLRQLEKIHTQIEGMVDAVYDKIQSTSGEIPREARSTLDGLVEEIRQEASDTADNLDGLRTALEAVWKKRGKKDKEE